MPGQLDARRCLAWLVQAPGVFPRQFRVALGDRMYGCDDCQTVCPINRLATRRIRPPTPKPDSQPSVDILRLLACRDETLMDLVGRWYIPGREPRYVRRNALVVLGNTGDPAIPAVDAACQARSADPDPIIRAHAVWAAARLGRRDLLAAVGGRPRPAGVGRAGREISRRSVRRPLMTRHVLVTNDFPPKIGGIQSYLWELWRRLPPEDVTVLTSPYADAELFDRSQPFRIERMREPVLLPHPILASRVRRLAAEVGAKAIVLDPAVPLGLIGPSLGLPYAAVLHGSEVTVPGRLPGTKRCWAGSCERLPADHRGRIPRGGGPPGEADAAADRPGPPGRRHQPVRPAGPRSSEPAPGPGSACRRPARWC